VLTINARFWREAEVVKVAENVSPRLGTRRRSTEKSRPRGGRWFTFFYI
jgi:hypothetical protein